MSAPSLMEIGMSPLGLAARTVIAAACWAAARRFGRRAVSRPGRAALFAFQALVGSIAAGLGLLALGSVLSYGGWPVWVAALAAGFAVEAVLALYAAERAAVSRGQGLLLVGLRIAFVLLAALLLLQPVYEKKWNRTVERDVAVLLDVSASMRLADPQRSGSEILRLAAMAGAPATLPAPLDGDRPRLLKLADALAAEADRLDGFRHLDSASVASRMAERRRALGGLLEGVARAAQDQVGRVAAADPADAARVRALCANEIAPRAEALQALVRDGKDEALAAGCRKLVEEARRLAQALRETVSALAAATYRQENAHYAALDAAARARLNDGVPAGRQEWVRRTLLAPLGEGQPGLLDRIGESHTVRLYEFAAAAEPADAAQWRQRPPAEPVSGDDAARLPGTVQSTDYAAALQRVLRDVPPEKLSSVVLVTDGRMDARSNPQPELAELADRAVPVSSVLIGSREAPCDAGVVRIDAPVQIFEGDKLLAKVDVKFDGLNGRRAAVRLEHKGQTVDEKSVAVTGSVFRATVELTHAGAARGIARYTVALDTFEGEFQTRNNRRELFVAVGDDRIKLLVIDDRPRWEYRYLRNLFGIRNKDVKLQHMLFHPSRIDGQAELPVVRASADRPPEQAECNALPADAESWLRFDAVVLGDVSPADLGEDAARALRRFVAERGGTLIVIAGDRNLPRAYSSGPLVEMLPLVFTNAAAAPAAAPFRLALTAAGADHTVMRLADAPEQNLRAWREMPLIQWRCPVADARPAATVLAYATPRAADGTNAVADAGEPQDVRRLQDRLAQEKANALVALQDYGAGRVLMLCFDSTWRLRYQAGDTYHHRFWGQILRWACADKLAAGTAHVRLGTDRVLYSPTDRVMIRAQLTKNDYSPVTATGVTARVYADDALVAQKVLAHVPGSAGHYRAEVGPFPPGTVGRIELDTPSIAPLVETNALPAIETGFVVASDRASELVDVGADPAALNEMAQVTGGTVAAPPERAAVLQRLGPPTQQVVERRTFSLWNSWAGLALMLGVATAEWLLRKRLGLT